MAHPAEAKGFYAGWNPSEKLENILIVQLTVMNERLLSLNNPLPQVLLISSGIMCEEDTKNDPSAETPYASFRMRIWIFQLGGG